MELHFKKPSKETRNAMCETAMTIDYASNRGFDEIKLAQDKISEITGHNHVKTVNSGNSAILAAMNSFKDKILIPDQGGWTGFRNMAEFRGIEVVEVPTDIGIISPETLEETINKHKPEALFITSFAGYIAEQPVKELFEICDDKGVMLVEDASGGVGDKEKKLGNGEHAHVIVASTGSPKIVNVGNGGFISTNYNELFKESKVLLKTLKASPVTCAGISAEIKNASQILSKTTEACDILKKEFESALHPDKRGISVALKTDDPKKTGYLLRQKLKADGRGIITICPRYERVMMDAVCIEVKNLDMQSLENGSLKEVVQFVKGIIG
ncbi:MULTISPECIES: DegT/DnrJ/EryC1/StrS family aminotransferase [Methanobacterium]|uniref:Cell wall biogenesis protein n=1 Tax=Methanobacterium bryantii TaxID=2161 RepID=A0A2A2H9R6_METBR|nr:MULTISPECIES: DegT/DnrJ/EryC1/StrS family aminotransferase [Methanobacterium]OEC86943.1 cell wall biogenesis protein [Methanobacterium sp. A39]PAV06004.1 cell wall biogenesis protein [Methanobacterium bryantii]